MGNRRKKSKKRRSSIRANKPIRVMTAEDIAKIEKILKRMKVDLLRAIQLSHDMGKSILDEERHEFWALVKYAENVQDGIVQLDNINKTIFPCLLEFPERSANETETSWKSLKGMRSQLAHAFDNINHNILWGTATQDFPKLTELLDVLQIIRTERGTLNISFKVGIWRSLPNVKDGERLKGGNSIPTILFDETGEAVCVRIGRASDKTVVISSTQGMLKMQQITLVDPEDKDETELLWPVPVKENDIHG